MFIKQYSSLVRPVLIIVFGATVIALGNFYSSKSKVEMIELAHTIQAQCNRDGFCKLPNGQWQTAEYDSTIFFSHTTGLVPMRLILTFNDGKNERNSCHVKNSGKSFYSFQLVRQLEDNNYEAYGGAKCPLIFSDLSE